MSRIAWVTIVFGSLTLAGCVSATKKHALDQTSRQKPGLSVESIGPPKTLLEACNQLSHAITVTSERPAWVSDKAWSKIGILSTEQRTSLLAGLQRRLALVLPNSFAYARDGQGAFLAYKSCVIDDRGSRMDLTWDVRDSITLINLIVSATPSTITDDEVARVEPPRPTPKSRNVDCD